MSSLILNGRRRFFELQKWRHLRYAVNIVRNASLFSSAALVSRKGQNFTVSTYLVESLGFTTEFAESISKKVSFNGKINRDEFVMIVKRSPPCLGFSSETVKRKTEFLVKEINWPLKAVVSNPVVLGLSMEKRIVPRCNVIKALMSKGLLGSELPYIGSVLLCTNNMFLERYVMKHDDEQIVAELMTIFTRVHVST